MENDDTENSGTQQPKKPPEPPRDFSDVEQFLDGETPWRDRERSQLFPERPAGVEFGVLLKKTREADGGIVRCRDFTEIQQIIGKQSQNVEAVWIPGSEFGIPWELLPSTKFRGREGAWNYFSTVAKSKGLLGLGLLAFAIYQKEFFLIFFAIFLILPVFDALMTWLAFPKDLLAREVRNRGINITLFHKWLEKRGRSIKPLIGFLVVLGIVFLVQVFKSEQLSVFGKFMAPEIGEAALEKKAVIAGEWWRILTSGMLHGFIFHIWFNGSALYSLGRCLTSLSNVYTLTIVFLASVVGGSLASLAFKTISSGPTVGASGGILGLLGYLLFVALRFRKTIPFDLTNMLIRNVVLISLIGVLGAKFIDNAAHAGGLITGIVVGAIIGPHRQDWWNQKADVVTQAVAIVCGGVLAWTVYKTIIEIW